MDWDNDGRHDLLIGDGNGNVSVYLNTNTNTSPVLSGRFYVMASGQKLSVGERAAPVADDWNGDGKKDLLIGNMSGNIVIYINAGTDEAPAFISSCMLKAGGRILDISSRTAPRVYDWNRDGRKDLLVGEIGGYVYFLINTGTDESPVFEKAEKLFLRSGDTLRYPDPSGEARSRLFVTDWNNDGHDDILLGGRDGKVLLFKSASAPSYSPRRLINSTLTQLKEMALRLKKKFKETMRN